MDRDGSECHELLIRDSRTGRDLETVTASAHGDFVWAADGRTIFYTVLDEHHRPNEVRRHRLGDDPAHDAVVYREPDPGFFVDLDSTESGRFVVIAARDHALTSELRVVPASSPTADPVVVAAREPGVDYAIGDDGDRFLVLTNADGAEDYKISEAPVADPGRARWRDVIAHEPGRTIVRLLLFRDFLVRLERADALPRIVVRPLRGGEEYAIDVDEEAYDLELERGFEYDTATLRFSRSSPATPTRTFDFDMESRARTLRKGTGDPERPRPRRLRRPPLRRDGSRRGADTGHRPAPARRGRGRLRPPAPLRLRRLRHEHPRRVLAPPVQPRRPRLRPRHRPRPRRHGAGIPLVPGTGSSRTRRIRSRTSSRRPRR